jgi:hypothetical protein
MRLRRSGHDDSAARFARRCAFTCALPVLLFAARDAAATRDRPPTRHSGGFGEPSCHACHFDQDVNRGGGAVLLQGLPERITPGAAYALTVVVTQPKMAAAGFQLTARHESGSQAGALRPAARETGRVDVTVDSTIAYVHHLYDGTLPVKDTARWSIVWEAPRDARPVTFHIAANAANDDASPLGDAIYTHTVRVTAGK